MYDTNEIYHHGILGQKWGKKNGPPYPLDGADHSAAEKKAGWRKSLDKDSTESKDNHDFIYKDAYDQYKKWGYDHAEAKALAEKKQKMYRNILIAAGVATGVALGGALAYKFGTNYVDYVIKAGTTVQTLSKDPDRLQKGHLFYTNYLKMDKNIYAGSGFAKTTKFNTQTMLHEKVFKNKIQAKALQDMKIASDKSGQKIFTEAFQSPEAKQVFDEVRRHYVDYPDQIDTRLVRFMDNVEDGSIVKYANKKMIYVGRPFQSGKRLTYYESFNKNIMPLDDPQAMKITKVFTDALEKKGYAGVIDVNDTKISRLRGVRPTIITDKSKIDIPNAISKQLTTEEHNKLSRGSQWRMVTLNALDEYPIYTALYSGMMTGGLASYGMVLRDAKIELDAPKNKKNDKSQ